MHFGKYGAPVTARLTFNGHSVISRSTTPTNTSNNFFYFQLSFHWPYKEKHFQIMFLLKFGSLYINIIPTYSVYINRVFYILNISKIHCYKYVIPSSINRHIEKYYFNFMHCNFQKCNCLLRKNLDACRRMFSLLKKHGMSNNRHII